jgi:HD-GYP domain-containing protein (c-di-GMP phosphodiesterase class II)
MNILVIFEEQDKRSLVTFFLEAKLVATVHAVRTMAGASLEVMPAPPSSPTPVTPLPSPKTYDLILCDYSREGSSLITRLAAEGKSIELLGAVSVSGTDPAPIPPNPAVRLFPAESFLQGVDASIHVLFKLPASAVPLSSEGEYCRIRPQLLLIMSRLTGDLFVRLSDAKFVRIMRKGLAFERDDLDYFSQKRKFEYLYVKKEDAASFAFGIQDGINKGRPGFASIEISQPKPLPLASSLPLNATEKAAIDIKRQRLELLQAKTRELALQKSQVERKGPSSGPPIPKAPPSAVGAPQAPSVPPAKPIELKNLVNGLEKDPAKLIAIAKALEKDLATELESVQKMGKSMGFTKEVQSITKNGVMSTITAIRSAPKLSALLAALRNEKERYIPSHSMLLAYMGCALAGQMEWRSDSTYQKITLAAFLHDASLSNHELAAVQSLPELQEKQSRFTPEEMKQYRDHPLVAADIARVFSEIPPDVDAIIAQHHERADAQGFPRNLPHSRIGPLSSVFIIAHDLVSFLYKNQAKYQFVNFKKVLAAVPRISV